MREPAPPYAGEGPHALWHVSENGAIARHVSAGIELRPVDPLLPFRDDVVASTLEYSGIRLRNARLPA